MLKNEAIALMQTGVKMTHRYFSPDEWVTIENGKYLLEDGVHASPFLFWYDRRGPDWEDGWEIWFHVPRSQHVEGVAFDFDIPKEVVGDGLEAKFIVWDDLIPEPKPEFNEWAATIEAAFLAGFEQSSDDIEPEALYLEALTYLTTNKIDF